MARFLVLVTENLADIQQKDRYDVVLANPPFGGNLGKTNPLNDDDLAEFVKLQKKFTDSGKS